MTRKEMIKELEKKCNETVCRECVRYEGVLTDSITDCCFKLFTDEEVTRAYEKMVMNIIGVPEIKDNSILVNDGEMQVFVDGNGNELGQRNNQENKGRFDLMPLDIVANWLDRQGVEKKYTDILRKIEEYKTSKSSEHLYDALTMFKDATKNTEYYILDEVSIHYRDGARIYKEDNWRNGGLPVKSYLSSATRHFSKFIFVHEDEPHHRGFIWNILGALWTIEHRPELIDAPFNPVSNVSNKE